MIWFTADLHLGHANVIKYSHRPVRDVQHMNEVLVSNWNDRVQTGDTVYLLGDVGFMPLPALLAWTDKLRGNKYLVRGNHDKKLTPKNPGPFVAVLDYVELKIPVEGSEHPQLIVMSHYPFATWNKAHYGSWCLHGHSHGSYRPGRPETKDGGRILDVGVDCHGLAPINLDQLRVIMESKTFRAADHHGERRQEA